MNSHSLLPLPGDSDEKTAYTVSELAAMIEQVLSQAFPSMVWVEGEVANLQRSNTGHVYLDLVERLPQGEQALLHSVIWNSRKFAINQALRRAKWGQVSEGDEIRARVGVDFYSRQGRVSLRIEEVDPSYTLSRWKAQRERVVALLRKEGVFDSNRRLNMSAAPYRLGLITSAGSNAYADFTTTLAEGGLGWDVLFHHSGVQGEAARPALIEALRRLAELRPDAICLVRGGGSTTDLAVFDYEDVARAIARCPVPVITGIGHELDRTVSDLVAHHSEKTPTACASWFVERNTRFVRQVHELGRWVAEAAGGLVMGHRRRLDGSPGEVRGAVDGAFIRRRQHLERSSRMLPAVVNPQLRGAEKTIAARAASLMRESRQNLQREKAGLDTARRVAEAYDPQRNLARGWSITRHRGGGVIGSISQIRVGETVETWLSDGTVTSRVSEARPAREPAIDKEI